MIKGVGLVLRPTPMDPSQEIKYRMFATGDP